MGAIITGIDQVQVDTLTSRHDSFFESAALQLGIEHWDSGLTAYTARLTGLDFRGWEISSAVGFSGFVVAKSVTQID